MGPEMSKSCPRDVWHDELLATIRARAEENSRSARPAPTRGVVSSNWPEVSSLLNRAGAVAVADASIPVGGHHTGVRRALVIGIRRVIVTLLHFLTARQSEYNLAVLHALRDTAQGLRSLEQQADARDKEIEQLRERISHLEAHLPIQGARKAS
jgi:hypothetical protein